MNDSLIEMIVPELRPALLGLAFRELIQFSDDEYVVAFEGEEFRLLFIGIEPREPRIYLVKRRLRDLKKQKTNPSKFVVDITKAFGGLRVMDVEKVINERVIEFKFERDATLIVQLTGKSANLFLLDADRSIIAAAKKPGSEEQALGKIYFPPSPADTSKERKFEGDIPIEGGSISESLDKYFEERKAKEGFEDLASSARRKNRNKVRKLQKLVKNLNTDLEQHGDSDKWKRYGDLLLASVSNASRRGNAFLVNDVFEPSAPRIEIEADENDSVAEAAQRYFRRYTKSRNALVEIEVRIRSAKEQIESAEKVGREIEAAIAREDTQFLKGFLGTAVQKKPAKNLKQVSRLPIGIRSFISSDGFEILVGKKATDNDVLTFKVANSRDLWMHAADYPGSHVVVRNPDRKDVPHKTLIEAAQLAAFYSQGKKQPKAAVHYTEKKFVNKPKGAAPGLVRLASFKTLLVEPAFPAVSSK